MKLPQTTFKPYERCISEKFKDLPPSALALVDTLLSIDPDGRGTATAALNSEVSTFMHLHGFCMAISQITKQKIKIILKIFFSK